MKHINIPVEEKMWRDLKQKALDADGSVAGLVRGLIEFDLYGFKYGTQCPIRHESPAAMKDGYEYDPKTRKNVKKDQLPTKGD